jgi:hypothetical protein
MSDYIGSRPITQRLSNDERGDAVQALTRFEAEGRLSPEELTTRTAAARVAATWGDLVPLFNDLPPSGPAHPAFVEGGVSGDEFDNGAEIFGGGSPWQGRRRALGGAAGATIMALTPFIAILLFFLTSYTVGWAWSWLWFLLIPVAGIIIWGPNSGDRYRRR